MMATGRQLLLGLDVGTTATKAVVFDCHGHRVAAAAQSYELLTPRPGWVEQDPKALWQAVVTTLRDVVAQQVPGDQIVALSLASQGGTSIPVDAHAVPTYHAISWMDERGSDGVFDADAVRQTTGWHLGNTLPLRHLGWLRDARPGVLARTARVLFVNDFILHHLAGQAVMNPSDATMTQLFDIAAGDWDESLLAAVGLERQHVSAIRPSGDRVGMLSAEASRLTGLPRSTLVVNGAHDQYCAAVGTGMTHPGAMLVSSGTAWVVLAVPEDLATGLASGMAISCHAIPERWGAIRSLGGVGASLEWLLKTTGFVPTDAAPAGVAPSGARLSDPHLRVTAYHALNSAAMQSPPGARGLLFYPLAGGHRRIGAGHGGFLHLTLEHTRGDMARAVMESTSFELRWALDEIKARGVPVTSLTLVGGAATSPLWPQLIADVMKVPVSLPTEPQAAARGAAILAGVGAGIFPDPEAGFRSFQAQDTILHSENTATYDALYARYQRWYEKLYAPDNDNTGGISV